MTYTDILSAMRERHSVRTYAGLPLTGAERSALLKVISEARSPFAPPEDVSITLADFELSGPYKPGTYGVINGASSFLLMGYEDNADARLAAGFTMEQVVLRATELGLGTCWIAATFRGTDFAAKADFPQGRELKIISPVGQAAEKRSLRERITRMVARSDKRRPFDELFFIGDFHRLLSRKHTFAPALEMMRLAPSAMNSQPWRTLVDSDGAVHFYFDTSDKLAHLDCGIGLCHFALAEQAAGEAQGLFYTEPTPPECPAKLRYLRSYRRTQIEPLQ